LLVYIFNFLKDSFKHNIFFHFINPFLSHVFSIFGESSLGSWVVVVDLVVLELHVHGIFSLTSLVERVLKLMWVLLAEVLSVEVVSGLKEHEVWVVVVLGVEVWLPVSTSKGEPSV